MFKMNAGYFLVQIASESDKEKVCVNPVVVLEALLPVSLIDDIGIQTVWRALP